jgi:hypothetical protein
MEATIVGWGIFIAVPMSETSEHAYLENKYGTFARFYGPGANKNMQLLIDAICASPAPKEESSAKS